MGVGFVTLLLAHDCTAVVIPFDDLTLVAADTNDGTNILNVTVQPTGFPSDTQSSVLSGTMTGSVNLEGSGVDATLTQLSFDGGRLFGSDATFTFPLPAPFIGNLTVLARNLTGTVGTETPPGAVIEDQIDSSDHQLTIDRGTIEGLGATLIDFTLTPLTSSGNGDGSALVTPTGDGQFGLEVVLPLMFAYEFASENVPLLGSVTGMVLADTVIVATGTLTLPPSEDLNGDGAVDAADAGLMFSNWGQAGIGDVNQDGIVDAADAAALFVVWTGDSDVHAVPEPAGAAWLLAMGLLTMGRWASGRCATQS